MKTLSEIKDFMGFIVLPAVLDDQNNVVTPEIDLSEGFTFYAIDINTVTSNPIEFAGDHVTESCFASVDNNFLYIATKGTCNVGDVVIV